MKPEDILALLPVGEKPAVTVDGDVASLTYPADARSAARLSLDDAAIRGAFSVLSAEQDDVGVYGGDKRLVQLQGFRVRYVLAPKSSAPKPPKSNG